MSLLGTVSLEDSNSKLKAGISLLKERLHQLGKDKHPHPMSDVLGAEGESPSYLIVVNRKTAKHCPFFVRV